VQLRELRELCRRRGWNVAGTFTDIGVSGGDEHRPRLDQLLVGCRKRIYDVVVVYRYDRFARSVRHLVNALAEFDGLGIQFVSVHEGVDTSTPNGPIGLRHIRHNRRVRARTDSRTRPLRPGCGAFAWQTPWSATKNDRRREDRRDAGSGSFLARDQPRVEGGSWHSSKRLREVCEKLFRDGARKRVNSFGIPRTA